jgi:hypothetical protein
LYSNVATLEYSFWIVFEGDFWLGLHNGFLLNGF